MKKADIQSRIKAIKSVADLAELLEDIRYEEFGIKQHKITKAQLNFFSTSKNNPKRYRTFYIRKKNGDRREIKAPCYQLNIILRMLNIVLNSVFEPTSAAMGFVPGRSVVDNARIHVGQNYVFNIDLKDFFSSITQPRVWKRLQLEPFNFTQEVASIIAGLSCTFNDETGLNVLPQGSPTSPLLTNAICCNLDRKMKGVAKRFGLHFSRYADDMTFSSMHNVYQEDSDFRKEIHKIITAEGFKVNEQKTRLLKKDCRQEVTGLTVNSVVNVSRKYVKELRWTLRIWEKYGYAQAYTLFYLRYKAEKGYIKKDDPIMKNVVAGKLNYLRMVRGASNPTYQKLKERYDDLLQNHQVLEYVHNSDERRMTERSGSIENGVHRVLIDIFFEHPTKDFKKAFDSLSKGDNLTIAISDGDVVLQKDGVTIGRLPKPAISQTGAFYKHNKGWRTDVTKVDGEIVSNLKDFLSDVLKSEAGKHINDCIAELNFTNPTKERKEELINEIYNELISKFDVVGKGFVAKDASKQDVVEHLANLWKYYTSVASAEPEVKEMLIDISLDKWFEKLYKEYKLIDDLAKTTSDTFDNIEVTVENINSGEINRVVNTERIDEEGNYDKFNYSNEAFADDVKDKVVVSVAKKQGEVTRTDGNVEDYIAASKAGTIYIGVPNKNGSWDYVVGTSVVFGDNKLNSNSDAGKLISAIRAELNSIIDSKDDVYLYTLDISDKLDKLHHFLQYLFYMPGITPLFYGVSYNPKTRKLYINDTNKQLLINGSTINDPNFKTSLHDIINNAKFNVAYSYIDGDTDRFGHNGLAYRETKGGKNKFVVEIPNYNDDANPRLRLEYDSFNQFAINSGILKVNIEVKDGSNYSRKGKNQKANQVLNVKLTSKTTSPVEEHVDNSQTTSSTSNAICFNIKNITENKDKQDSNTTAIEERVEKESTEIEESTEVKTETEEFDLDDIFNAADEAHAKHNYDIRG